MANPLVFVFGCLREKCECSTTQENATKPVLLPRRETPLGRYGIERYEPSPAPAWPIKFVCYQCADQSSHRKEDIIRLDFGNLDGRYFTGKMLWRIEIALDSEIEIYYTIAAWNFDCEDFARRLFPQPHPNSKVTATSYPDDFWPPETGKKSIGGKAISLD